MFSTQNDRPEILDALYEASNLTADQLMFWVGQKLNVNVPLYNLAQFFTFTQAIDPACFEAAFQTLVNSSDVLRMVIDEVDGIPQYRINPAGPFKLEYLDFSDEASPEATLRAQMTARASRLFDFKTALFDAALIKVSTQKYIWYFNQHHIIGDGISILDLILSNLSELYGQAVAGTLPDQIDLPQFAHYVEQQRVYRHSERFHRAESYWQQKLAHLRNTPSLYGSSPSKFATRTERIECKLGAERSQRLKQLAKQGNIYRSSLNASLFNIFATLLITYIHRLSSNEQIALGVPFHNRRTPAAKRTIGLLLQTLPLQVTISAGDTFVSLLNKIAADMLDTVRHSPYAGPRIGQSYDLLLNYHVAGNLRFLGSPIGFEWIHLGYGHKSLLLQVHDFEGTGQFTLFFEPSCDIFTPQQRQQMPKHYVQLLDAFLENPSQLIHQTNLLPAEERHQLLVEWNDTFANYPKDKCIHQLFEEQVERTPNATAVVFGEQQLSYLELNHRANQLAHHLQKQGIGPETLVGVCLERSPEMVIAILGILKAGGAYVPIDPTYPKERIAFMLNDAQARLLVTHRHLQAALPDYHPPLLYLDPDYEMTSDGITASPPTPVTSNNLAYVIYTSGSTGKPKGVMVEHRAICNHLRWRQLTFPLNHTDAFLQKASAGFDISVWEIFAPLIAGARLVLARPHGEKDPGYLAQLIAEQQVTTIHFGPAALQAFLQVPNLERCAALKRLFCGGELLTPALQKQLFGRLNVQVYHQYGPTEAAVDVTYWTCQPESRQNIVPIGRPVANTQIYLLDPTLQPTPIGVPGELHIGGVQLARGYLNRPGLTAEKFIPNPFSAEPGDRLYKTGDLARYLPDGSIEFLGRIDHQVKIRGFRIELGEIEAVLGQHPAVNQSVVVAREDQPGDRRLVAYVVARQQSPPTSSDLRAFLKQKLPNYMVPSAFVGLDALPLTPNGKINRKALPEPDQSRPQLADAYTAPAGPVEEMLADVWQEILGLDKIGVHDNFFELGGHSLLATRVVSQLRYNYDIDIPLHHLFEAPTISELASVIEAMLLAEVEL